MAINDTGFVTPTATPNFDPGFVSMPQTQDTSVQTFAPSISPTIQTQSFVTSPVPTSAPISLAPFGAGLPRGDTSVSVGDVRSDSDGFGTAAKVGGAAALTALLNSLGQKEGGSGFSVNNIFSGVSKIAGLGKLAGVDVMKELQKVGGEVGEWAKGLFDGGTEAVRVYPKSVTDARQVTQPSRFTTTKATQAPSFPPASYQTSYLQSVPSSQLAEAIPSRLLATNPSAAMGISSTSSVATLGGPGSGAGGMGAGLVEGAGGSLAGAMPVLALWAFSIARFNASKDPTADTRAANEIENYFQRAGQSEGQKRLELENLKQIVYQDPYILNTMKIAARTADPNIQHTSGGTEIVGWKGQIPAMFEELLPELEVVAKESNAANYGGQYNIGDQGLMGSPPNPYGEETRFFDPDSGWQTKSVPSEGVTGYTHLNIP